MSKLQNDNGCVSSKIKDTGIYRVFHQIRYRANS